MEGKDAPKELLCLLQKFTTGLLVRLTKALHYSRKVVVLDIGFCVLEANIALKNIGVYATAVIKKRRTGQNMFPKTKSTNG